MPSSDDNAPNSGKAACGLPNSTHCSGENTRRLAALEAEVHDYRCRLEAKERELEAMRKRCTLERSARTIDCSTGLESSPDLLRKIIDNIPVMISMYDPRGKVPFLNSYARRLIGQSEAEVGETDVIRVCNLNSPSRQTIWEYMMQTPPGWKEIELEVPDNRTIMTTWANVRLSDGSYLGIGIDISERKRLREALREGEAELRRSRQLKLLGQLTTGIAHEVRNPLTGIVAIMEALRAEIGPGSEFDEYLRHMRIQVDRLERLMENLLTLGRPIRKSSMQPTMVREMIDEAIDIWNTRIDQRTQSVAAYIDPQVGGNTVLVDDGTMQQVIANLLDNANEHSPDDTGVEMRVEKAAERLVRIRVIDKGPGVSPEILRRIFEPFYTTRKAGTGLGLSIVHHVVDSHGGTVRLYNNDPGPGVTAEILLPLVVRRSTKSS